MFKKYRVFIFIGLFLLFGFAALQFPLNSSVDRFIVNHLEMDVDEIPRTVGGKVDFIRIIDDMTFLPAEENTMAGVVEVLGTDFAAGSIEEKKFFEDLGVSTYGPFMEDISVYLPEEEGADDEAARELYDKLYTPWRKEQFPWAHQWLLKNNHHVDRLVKVSKRSGYYHPSKRTSDSDSMVSVLFPGFIQIRDAARVLNRRANFHLGNDDIESAIVDMTAIHELGAKMQSDGSLIQKLVGMAVVGNSFESFENVLANEKLTFEQIEAIHKKYFVQEPESLAASIDVYEGFSLLDSIQSFDRAENWDLLGWDGASFVADNNFDKFAAQFIYSRFTNWELAARSALKLNSRVIDICKIEDDFERLIAWEQYEAEIDQQYSDVAGRWTIGMSVLAGARSRGYMAGSSLAAMMTSSYSSVDAANVNQKILRDLTRIGLGIEEYRLRNGNYPEGLDDLVPEVLESVPVDRFTNQPLTYKLTEKYYFVGSAGRDRVSQLQMFFDDAPEDARYDTDDRVLKVRLKNQNRASAVNE